MISNKYLQKALTTLENAASGLPPATSEKVSELVAFLSEHGRSLGGAALEVIFSGSGAIYPRGEGGWSAVPGGPGLALGGVLGVSAAAFPLEDDTVCSLLVRGYLESLPDSEFLFRGPCQLTRLATEMCQCLSADELEVNLVISQAHLLLAEEAAVCV